MNLNSSQSNIFPKVYSNDFDYSVRENKTTSRINFKSNVFVSNNAKTDKKSTLSNLGKIIAITGGTVLLALGALLCKNKIDVQKAKKMETKAREAAKQAREAAQQKTKS